MDATTIKLYLGNGIYVIRDLMRVSAGGSQIPDPSHSGSGGRCRESGTGLARALSSVTFWW